AARPGTAVRNVRLAGQSVPTLAFPSSETATLPAHLPVENVTTWMTISRRAALYGPWLIPLAAPLLRGPLGHLLRHLAQRAAPPPSEELRQRMPFTILVGASARGASAALTLRGYDPYGLTAQILAHAAAQLLAGHPPAGVLPPALALDPAGLI